ncbi:hypothetical protein F4692_004089 [Nocardioides cavernae]|uniref:Tissue inhibitor of metalloproteinase n=1 Tax=Nocardioides cavernae TaxID=1921566 RepID=A0A7Y9H7U9_9ACTN|nr:hypothetical protein [Nocardioides cavernae]NYE38934.1 hypothetical protein [Nocardioides cavernae]
MPALTVLAFPTALVVGSASPGFACSCASQRPADLVALADHVFTGTVVDIGEPAGGGVVSSTDPVAYTIAVEAVHQGEVGSVAVVESAASGASCGLEGMVVDRHYVVFANADADRLTASSCGGTAPASPRLVRTVERLTGEPTAPDVSQVRREVVPDARSSRRSSPSAADVVTWVVGSAAVLAFVVATALGSRRRRRT